MHNRGFPISELAPLLQLLLLFMPPLWKLPVQGSRERLSEQIHEETITHMHELMNERVCGSE